MHSGCWGALRGTGPRATGTGVRFFVVRGPSRLYQRDAGFPASPTLPPQSLPHPGHPDNPGHPASDVIDIKGLTDLFCLLSRRFYRHSGPMDLDTESLWPSLYETRHIIHGTRED